MTGYYLLDHPNPNCPERGDGRYWGYAEMSQLPVWVTVHTTESFADLIAPDMGAEAVANYFATTATPASYHTLVDSDSTVDCLPAGLDEHPPHVAFHCYGRNTANLGISFALRATEWATIPNEWKQAALARGADVVAAWCRRWDIPVRRVTLEQVEAGVPGITGHGILQDDRTDPGASRVFSPSLFPWDEFLAMVDERLNGAPVAAGRKEFELYAAKSNAGIPLLIDGCTYQALTGPWEQTNAALIELARAGLIPAEADGETPLLPVLGDNALSLMREVTA